jgi:hypothetical protein
VNGKSLAAHVVTWLVLLAILAAWIAPSRWGNWIFIAVFALAFVLGPWTHRQTTAKKRDKPITLPWKNDPAQPEPSDTKAIAKRIGLDG